jgi:hypothetical protein
LFAIDGVEVDTPGPLRRLELHDGLYVVGEGRLIPCADEKEVAETIADLQRKGDKV